MKFHLTTKSVPIKNVTAVAQISDELIAVRVGKYEIAVLEFDSGEMVWLSIDRGYSDNDEEMLLCVASTKGDGLLKKISINQTEAEISLFSALTGPVIQCSVALAHMQFVICDQNGVIQSYSLGSKEHTDFSFLAANDRVRFIAGLSNTLFVTENYGTLNFWNYENIEPVESIPTTGLIFLEKLTDSRLAYVNQAQSGLEIIDVSYSKGAVSGALI